jgi:predicted glycosyl hydrolase (DUF1957 family)
MLKWVNFLHFYQPASIEKDKIIEALEKSYTNIVAILEKHPQTRITANFTSCLLDRIDEEIKNSDLIERVKKLVQNGQIELVGSAAYHPIIPLIKKKEAISQIKENEERLKKYFGQNIRLSGFFLPEMAYSAEVAKIIKKLGYKWIIIDEISAYGKLGAVNNESNHSDIYSGLQLVFRNRQYSQEYVPETILKASLASENSETTIITATDAELYGLRHVDSRGDFEMALNSEKITTSTISEYLESVKAKPILRIDPIASSWETTEQEIINGQPFNLWDDATNDIQVKLWKLARFAEGSFLRYKNDPNIKWSHWHLARGLASCTFWWASGKDLKHVYGPIAWNPDEVEKGTFELIKAIRSLENSTSLKEKLKGESLYYSAKKSIWEKHWQLFHEKLEVPKTDQ